jgi:hypothetical protein
MMAVCTSCPQAWQTPGFWEAYGRPVASAMGSASMSARSPLELVDDQRSGAVLEVADLRVSVDVATDPDQPLLQFGDDLPDGRTPFLVRSVHPHSTQSDMLEFWTCRAGRVVT